MLQGKFCRHEQQHEAVIQAVFQDFHWGCRQKPGSGLCSQLTVVGHRCPAVELPFVEHGVELAALDLAEGGLVGGTRPDVANPEPLPLPQAVPAPVLRPVHGREQGKAENHRRVWVGRDLKAHLVQLPCHGQGPLPPAQGAQSPIQPGLEH